MAISQQLLDRDLSLTWSKLLVGGFILRLFLSLYGTYQIDFDTWRSWANTLTEVGFSEFYQQTWCDYLPGYLYILRGLNWVHANLPWLSEKILFKLPANLADLGIALTIYGVLSQITQTKKAKLASLAYFFNPASLANSTFWGQIDSVHGLLILLAILLGTGEQFFFAGILAALSFMIKPQSVVLLPILGFFLVRFWLKQRLSLRQLLPGIKLVLALGLTCFGLILPFVWSDVTSVASFLTQPLLFLLKRFTDTYNQYSLTSVNAFNFWGAVVMKQSDQLVFGGLSYQNWGTLLFGSYYGVILGCLFLPELRQWQLNNWHWNRWLAQRLPPEKRRAAVLNRVFDAVILILFALFLFVTRAHERHFLPAIVLLTLTLVRSSKYWWMYGLVSGIYCLNMVYAYEKLTSGYAPTWLDAWIPVFFGLLFLVFGLLLVAFIHKSMRLSRRVGKESS